MDKLTPNTARKDSGCNWENFKSKIGNPPPKKKKRARTISKVNPNLVSFTKLYMLLNKIT